VEVEAAMRIMNAMIPFIALVLSVLSIYIQYGDPSEEVLASVLSLENDKTTLSASIALINAGQRPAVVHAIKIMWAESTSNCKQPLYLEEAGEQGGAGSLPALLEPEGIRVVSLRAPFPGELEKRGNHNYGICFKFASLDSAGKRFSSISSVAEVRYKQAGVQSRVEVVRRDDKTIDLLESVDAD
jgi:hypothetical protein